MTLTIHRQVWLQRLAISLGLAAILTIVAFAAFQRTSTEPAEAPAADVPVVIAETESAGYWLKLQSLQDNYLPPTAASQLEVDPNGLTDDRVAGPR